MFNIEMGTVKIYNSKMCIYTCAHHSSSSSSDNNIALFNCNKFPLIGVSLYCNRSSIDYNIGFRRQLQWWKEQYRIQLHYLPMIPNCEAQKPTYFISFIGTFVQIPSSHQTKSNDGNGRYYNKVTGIH